MKIALNAHLLSSQAGYRSAGIHHYIDNLLRELPSAMPDAQFTAFVGAKNRAEYAGMTMRRASMNTEPPINRIIWEQLVQPFALPGFRLYHALAFIAPTLMLAPMVVTVYDLSFIHYPTRLPMLRQRYLQRFTTLTCERAFRIIAISHSTARDLTHTLGVEPERVDVAQPGCDFNRFKPLPADQIASFRRQADLPDRFWLFIGTLEPRKNLPMLLEAYAAVPRAERLPLVLAGGKGWDYEPIFATVKRCGLEREVRFPGYLSPEALPLWYNAAETFLYPSVYEGFGIPVLEAMACGTPVIVSNVSSLPEVAEDAGVCLPPRDVAAWTQALRRAGADAEWRTAARTAGLAQAAQFTWQDTAQATVESYRRALRM
jgi:glycosyltransferase involved in cell wall biosynthesis